MAYLRVAYSASLHYIVSEDTMAYHSCLNIYCTAMKALKQNPNIQEEFNKTYAERFAVLDFFPPAIPHLNTFLPPHDYINHWKKHLRETHLKTFMNDHIHNIKINIYTA